MSKLKKFLSKPRISRLVSFSVVLILIAGSAYFAYKRGVFASINDTGCTIKLNTTIQREVGSWSSLYLIRAQDRTNVLNGNIQNPTDLQQIVNSVRLDDSSKSISVNGDIAGGVFLFGRTGSSRPVPVSSNTFQCTGGTAFSVTTANLTAATPSIVVATTSPTAGSTGQIGNQINNASNLVCVKTSDNPDNPVLIDRSLMASMPWYYTEVHNDLCTSGESGSENDDAPVAATTKPGCQAEEECVTSPGRSKPYCAKESDLIGESRTISNYSHATGCTYISTENDNADAAVACDTENDCIEKLGDGYTCEQEVCVKKSGDTTIAGAEGQGAGQIVPKVPVAGLGTQGAPGGIGKVIFSAWRASQNSDSDYVPVGGVGLNISGEIQQTPGDVKSGNAQETDAKRFANNQACNTWDTIRKSVRGLLGETVSYKIITPDNGLTKNATQVLDMPVGFYRITINKDHFSLPSSTSLEKNNSICFYVTKDQITEVKVQLLAKGGAEPPGIDGDVLYQKKSRFTSKAKDGEVMYRPSASYYGWQKISGDATKDWGYNPTKPRGVDDNGSLIPGIPPGLGMPGGSMGSFINLCQGLNLTIDGVKIDKTKAMIGGAFINSIGSIIKGAKGKTIAGKALEGGAIGYVLSKFLGNGTDITVNLGSLNQQCNAFNQLGIPSQCYGCLTGGYCPPGCLANSAFAQSAFQLQNIFR